MSDALTVRSFAEGKELAASLKVSALVPEALRGKEADILFIVLTGAEMGMGPMKSLQAFESIKGRVGMKPVYMLGMVRAHPSIADITLETTATKAVVTSVRKNSPKVLRTEFSIEDAKTAGLTSSDMYRKWPARMLGWRCVAIHCREHHSDITGGHYSSEEVESFEKDVTPTEKQIESTATTVSPTEDLKAVLKSKRREAVADVAEDAAPVPSPPRPAEENSGPVLDWPEAYVGKTLHRLTEKQLNWCVSAATKECDKGGPEAELFAHRLMQFTDEVSRRMAEAVAK